MKVLIIVSVFLLFKPTFSQVGINTTTPSPASVLDISSSNNGSSYGGVMPPRVTISQRDLIPVTSSDDGLLVYVMDGTSRFLQIYDGVEGVWQTIYPLNISLSAQLVGWDVAPLTNSGPSPFEATFIHPSITAGGLTRGAGMNNASGNNAWGGSGFNIASQSEAITANKFATFTITPSFGLNISLTAIEPYYIRRSATGPILGIWQYSNNGVDFIDLGSEISWGDILGSLGNPHAAIDLSGISALQNLTSATTVTFRIVIWGATGSTGTWYIENSASGNDLILRGNIK